MIILISYAHETYTNRQQFSYFSALSQWIEQFLECTTLPPPTWCATALGLTSTGWPVLSFESTSPLISSCLIVFNIEEQDSGTFEKITTFIWEHNFHRDCEQW